MNTVVLVKKDIGYGFCNLFEIENNNGKKIHLDYRAIKGHMDFRVCLVCQAGLGSVVQWDPEVLMDAMVQVV